MNARVDFEAVKTARAELAELAKQHPELCQGSGTWANNLDTLEDMIMTPGKTRMAKYRARQQEKGLKTVTVFLTPAAQQRLNAIMAERPAATMGEIISEALTATEQPKSAA